MFPPSRRARAVRRSLLTALAAAFAVAGCGRVDASSAPAMANPHPTAEALVEAALNALARNDREAMESLLVTRNEHHDLLWASLPESEHLTFEYARWLNEHNTGKALDRALGHFGGQEFSLEGIEYTKERETYPGFTLHRGAKLTVVRESDGAKGELILVDVLVEHSEGWKLLDYEE